MNKSQGGIISEAIAFGSLQIPKNGQHIRGYPKIGTVLPIDCFKL